VPISIENALKISGWMKPEELTWLATMASTRKLVCEVGSWMGRSTRAIADNLPEGGVVYAVDTWNGTPGPNECGLLLQGKPEDWLFNQFRANIGEDLLHRKITVVENGREYPAERYTVRPYRASSLEGADYLCNHYTNRFDMIFLDAAHDYDNVKADILAWRPFLAPGGLLCGHDFGGSFPGVQRAVLELIPGAKKVGAGSIWGAPIL
jgi:hypothetical protein